MFSWSRLPLTVAFVGSGLAFTQCSQVPVRSTPAPGAPVPAPIVTGEGRVVILFLSDLHGQLRPNPSGLGGYARLTTKIREERQKADSKTDVLVIMGGDAAGKSALPCRKTGEKDCMPLLKQMGVDLAVLGNGELKRSAAELNELIQLSQIPWVSSNVKTKAPLKATWQDEYAFKGLKSGADWSLVGWSIVPTPGEVNLARVGYFANEKPNSVDWSRWTQAANTRPLLFLTHQLFDRDIALLDEACQKIPGKMLAVLKGHDHHVRFEDRSRCVPVFEPGAFGENISRVEFGRNEGGPWTLVKHDFISIDANVAEDPAMKARIEALYAKSAPEADQVMGQVAAQRTQTEAAQWMVDTLLKVSHGDMAIVNGGAVKSGLEPGAVTRERLFTVYPYTNELIGVDVSIAELSASLCKAAQRPKDTFLDDGSELFFAGAQLVGVGTSNCHLEVGHRSRAKLVMDSYMLNRSARWMGIDLAPRAFNFGMNTEKMLERGLQMGGGKL